MKSRELLFFRSHSPLLAENSPRTMKNESSLMEASNGNNGKIPCNWKALLDFKLFNSLSVSVMRKCRVFCNILNNQAKHLSIIQHTWMVSFLIFSRGVVEQNLARLPSF